MKWNIDPTHSAVEFGVKHLGISTTKGRFQRFQGSVQTDPKGAPLALEVTIDAASIDTNVTDRDAHLRSGDFFDVARYPAISYRSTSVTPTGKGTYRIDGHLTMRGVARPVTFAAEIEPSLTDPWGNQRIAGRATGTLSRKEWGLTWNTVLEAGGLMVSDEVRFSLEVEVVGVVEEKVAVAA